MCRVPYQPTPACNHEEADTRICVHLNDALEKGARKVLIRTVDTDVIVILAGIFFELQSQYSNLDIWVAFGVGKNYQHFHLNDICQSFGEGKCKGLPSSMLSQAVILPHNFLVKGRSLPGRLGNRTPVSPEPLSIQLKTLFD